MSSPDPPFLLAPSVFAWNRFGPMWRWAAEWCAVWPGRLLHGGWSWSELPNTHTQPRPFESFLRNNISLRLVPISTTVQKAVSRTSSAHLMKMDFQECGMKWDIKIFLTTSQKDIFTRSISFWLAAHPFWKGCHLCLLTPRFYKSEKISFKNSVRLWNGVAWLPMLTVDHDLVLTLNCEPNRPSFVLKRKQPPNPTNKQIWIVRSTIVTSPNKTFPGVQLLLLTRPQQPLKTVDIQTSTAMLPEMATFQTRTTVGSTGTALGKGRAPKKNEHF